MLTIDRGKVIIIGRSRCIINSAWIKPREGRRKERRRTSTTPFIAFHRGDLFRLHLFGGGDGTTVLKDRQAR